MRFFLESLCTWTFWRHIFLSWKTYARFFEVVGALFVAVQIVDFFNLYRNAIHQPALLYGMFAIAGVAGIATRFPVRRVKYRIPGKDYFIEVLIGDILDAPNGVVISTNSTFDTNLTTKLISAESLQGQFTTRYFQGDAADLDRQITKSLNGLPNEPAESPGKRRKYALGTVAKVSVDGKFFYLLAMSDLNERGNAHTDERSFDVILNGLWTALREQGELGEIYVPIIGSGRGRLQIPRQKLIERIAQSFVYVSQEGKIANRLVIVVTDQDVKTYDLNLFQVRDYLTMSLHT
jgi:hypothetical protein